VGIIVGRAERGKSKLMPGYATRRWQEVLELTEAGMEPNLVAQSADFRGWGSAERSYLCTPQERYVLLAGTYGHRVVPHTGERVVDFPASWKKGFGCWIPSRHGIFAADAIRDGDYVTTRIRKLVERDDGEKDGVQLALEELITVGGALIAPWTTGARQMGEVSPHGMAAYADDDDGFWIGTTDLSGGRSHHLVHVATTGDTRIVARPRPSHPIAAWGDYLYAGEPDDPDTQSLQIIRAPASSGS
jgi:hypothetical protein